MNHSPRNLKFTRSHEWVRVEGRKLVIGITHFAQQQLSQIVNVDLPEPGDHHCYHAGEDFGIIESVKAAADFSAPVAGTVVAVNTELLHAPELINSDPYGAGWIIEMEPENPADVNRLIDSDAYEALLPEED